MSQYCDLYDQASSDTEFYKIAMKELERKNYELEQQNQSLQDAISSGPKILFDLDDLPTNLQDLLKLLEEKYENEVVVLQEAKDSSAEFDVKDLKKSWRALKSIPEILFPILFGEDEGDKQALYVNKAGFDLSMTESKMTKADKKLRDLRTRTYKNEEIEINAHIGFGNKKPNMLRVHFYVSSSDNKIVIGHCGDHLDNFSTKSRS